MQKYSRQDEQGWKPLGFAPGLPPRNEYQNEYQTASRRYVPIPADTHESLMRMCQKVPKKGDRLPIPTLASSSNRERGKEIERGKSRWLTVWLTILRLLKFVPLC